MQGGSVRFLTVQQCGEFIRYELNCLDCGPGFETGSVMWDFVVDKVALG
jgi:hypothetical protein